MKVYFAGSIRGGRVDAGLYHRMIVHIQKTDTVLTEHVGDLRLQESTTDTEIYAQDTEWLQMSYLKPCVMDVCRQRKNAQKKTWAALEWE